jgi:hypothetical protein
MQLHYLYNKDVQRPQKTTNGDLTPGFENEQPGNSDGAQNYFGRHRCCA